MKINKENTDIRYLSWVVAFIQLVKPGSLYLIGGRGVSKSTEILAKRTIDVVYDMPHAPLSFVSDTYINLMANIIPHILLGWTREKFYENIHYVVDKAPPDHWDKPFIKTFTYQHTISTFNGCKFFLSSIDRPSTHAGISTTVNSPDT